MAYDLVIVLVIILLAMLLASLAHPIKKIGTFFRDWHKKRFKTQFYIELKKINLQKVSPDLPISDMQLFREKLNQIVRLCERFEICFCLIQLEISHFDDLKKKLNHKAQIKLLSLSKNRLKKFLRRVDTITEMDDHSFLILLPMKYKAKNAAQIASRLQQSMITPFLIEKQVITAATHVGIAIYPDDGLESDELLQSVMEATEQARELGENRYHFHDPFLQDMHNQELIITSALQREHALDFLKIRTQTYMNTDRHQLEYLSLTPCMAHSTLGVVELIQYPRAVWASGKSLELFENLMLHAMRELSEWHTAWPTLQAVIVPITLSQCHDTQFIHKLTQLMKNHQVNSSQFIFDISAIDDTLNASSLTQLNQILNETGLKISLSLYLFSQLPVADISKLPVKLLKIDSFVLENIENNHNNIPLIKMITSIAENSSITLLAEQGRSNKEKILLHKLSCHLFYENRVDVPLNTSGLLLYQEKIKSGEKYG